MGFTSKQKGVVRGMAAALAVTLASFAVTLLWAPDIMPADPGNPALRMAFAFRTDVFVLLALAITIGAVAQHRFLTPADIDGSGLTEGTEAASVKRAVLQNTLEQSVLAVGAHLAWAVVMPPSLLVQVPLAVVLFVVGRICFWRGYAGGAPARAFGFALTFYPSALMLFGVAGWSLARLSGL